MENIQIRKNRSECRRLKFFCYGYLMFIKNYTSRLLERIKQSQSRMGWKGPADIIKSNLPAKQVPYNRSHRKASEWVLNIARVGDPTTSLSSLFQCFVALTVKNIFPVLTCNFLCSVSAYCPLFCCCSPRKRVCPPRFVSHT